MTTTDRLRRRELERLAARLDKVADAASRDFMGLFFSPQGGGSTIPRAKGGARLRGEGAGKGTS